MLGDADLDGQLTLDEYRDRFLASPRMRDAVATIEPIFRSGVTPSGDWLA
jgi:hypothetical protein